LLQPQALGFREATVGDEDKLAGWLAEQDCPVELSEDRLREAMVARCRAAEGGQAWTNEAFLKWALAAGPKAQPPG